MPSGVSAGRGAIIAKDPAMDPSMDPQADKATSSPQAGLPELMAEIIVCRACPRLVEHRELMGRRKRASYANWDYWARPVPSFGDPAAPLMVLGLAPASHGGNRTGRVFTGDPSATFLTAAMHQGRAGQSTQLRPPRRRPSAYWSLRLRRGPLCAARRPAHPGGAARLPALPGKRDATVDRAPGGVGLGTHCLSVRVASVGRTGVGTPSSQVPAWAGVPIRPLPARGGGLVPPQPAKHQHREAVDGPTGGSDCTSQRTKRAGSVAGGAGRYDPEQRSSIDSRTWTDTSRTASQWSPGEALTLQRRRRLRGKLVGLSILYRELFAGRSYYGGGASLPRAAAARS